MRQRRVLAACAAALFATAMAGPADADSASQVVHSDKFDTYIVVTSASDAADVAARLRTDGAQVTSVNESIGMVAVRSDDLNFRANAGAVKGVEGVAADRAIGKAPVRDVATVERENLTAARAGFKAGSQAGSRAAQKAPEAKVDPLDSNLWGMRMINADQAHETTLGSRDVLVGIMDTGVQADHPDIHSNFSYGLSRNFTTDIPAVDGPCEVASCIDPVGEDDNGHGTHVAGTVAAAMNGIGVSGVAPRSTIVEVRAGQDSGYFFAGPTVNALTYAGDAGLDAVNMSFYVDPWLYNCNGGAPEDTPEQAADQDTIITVMNRALSYAHDKGVTLLAAAGNANSDMANPGTDLTSPDYGEPAHARTINNDNCVSLPTEGPDVLGVTSLGPSGKKSDFSNWSTEALSGEVELSAPGGWFRDGFGTATYRTNGNLILSSFPLAALQESGEVDADGNVTDLGVSTGVVKQCQAKPEKGTTACGYYAWLQGTSMATPHATGVAALAIAAHGQHQSGGGFGLAPDAVRDLLLSAATDHACPEGGVQSYTNEGRPASYTATCEGTTQFNGFYGSGIVNALGVVR